MNDALKTEQTAMTSTERSGVVSTVGYLCIAATLWMTGMLMAGWFSPAIPPGLATGTIFGMGSALLVILGILSLIFGHRMMDTLAFLSMAGLFFSLRVAHLDGLAGGQTSAISGYVGWFALIWAVFYCYLWIATFGERKSTIRMLFFLILWLGALAAAIGGWIGSQGFEVLSGYLLLVTSILAFIVSAKEVFSHSLGKLGVKAKENSAPTHTNPGLATS